MSYIYNNKCIRNEHTNQNRLTKTLAVYKKLIINHI